MQLSQVLILAIHEYLMSPFCNYSYSEVIPNILLSKEFEMDQ
jgi:hypothetical protein